MFRDCNNHQVPALLLAQIMPHSTIAGAVLLQGVMGRMASWFGASTSGRNSSVHSRGQHGSSSGAPDFLAQADDPDKRRIDHARAQSRGDLWAALLALQSP